MRSQEIERSPAEQVIHTVARRKGVDPTDLPVLYDSIDPEALNDTIEAFSGDEACVSFDYAGFSVSIDGGGSVTLSEASGHAGGKAASD